MLLGNALEYLENQTMGDYPRILSRQAMKGPCWLHCPLSKQSCSLSGSLWYVQLMLVPGSRSICFPCCQSSPFSLKTNSMSEAKWGHTTGKRARAQRFPRLRGIPRRAAAAATAGDPSCETESSSSKPLAVGDCPVSSPEREVHGVAFLN